MILDKNSLPMVAVDFMNTIHLEDVEMVNELGELISKAKEDKSLEETIIEKLEFLQQHTVEHFRIEEEHMQKYNFFAYSCHKEEHDRVLNEFKSIVQTYKDNRDLNVIDSYFNNVLPNWILNHISTMDMVTAQFISQFK